MDAFDQLLMDRRSATNFIEGIDITPQDLQRDEAIRNASISSMLFMLTAKSKVWDTCPMIGYDTEKLKEILSISDNHEPLMMITIGKEKVQSRRPRGYRKPVGEFVKYF